MSLLMLPLLLLRCRERRSCTLPEVALILSLLFLLLPSVRCRVPKRHAEVAIFPSLLPLSLLQTLFLLLLPLLLLILRCRERRSHSLLEVALSLLLRLSLLLLLNVRCRERRSSLPEVASLPPMFLLMSLMSLPLTPLLLLMPLMSLFLWFWVHTNPVLPVTARFLN